MNYSSIIIALLVAMIGVTVASAEDNPFFGSWKVVSSTLWPDYDSGPLPKVDPELDGKTIIFAPNQAKGSCVVECEKPLYRLYTDDTPESLFQGTLKNPAKDAVTLGFKGDKIVTMHESCDSSTGDMYLDFHMVDHSTILLGINGRIYTLKRQSE